MKITKAEYITSAVAKLGILKDNIPEFAFVGRSNVGKSSLINSLVNQNRLAKTSSTPGYTKMVNYFNINDNIRFVDLPGYGFSKTGKTHRKNWATLVEDYLLSKENKKHIFLLVDIRHKPTEDDILMLKFLFFNNLPTTIIATKCDKIAKSKLPIYVQNIASTLCVGKENIITYSAETKIGTDKILEKMENVLNL